MRPVEHPVILVSSRKVPKLCIILLMSHRVFVSDRSCQGFQGTQCSEQAMKGTRRSSITSSSSAWSRIDLELSYSNTTMFYDSENPSLLENGSTIRTKTKTAEEPTFLILIAHSIHTSFTSAFSAIPGFNRPSSVCPPQLYWP